MAICFASAVWFDRKILRILVMAACVAVFVGISIAAPRWWFVECGSLISSLQESVLREHRRSWKTRIRTARHPISASGRPSGEPSGGCSGKPSAWTLWTSQTCRIPVPACWTMFQELQPRGNRLRSCLERRTSQLQKFGLGTIVLFADPSAPEATKSMPEQKWFMGVAEHAGYLILRLRYFPAWSVKVNGVPVTAVAERERGLMAVPVPQGNVQVSVNWTTTGDVVAGRWVSGVALLLVTGLYLFERKRLRVRLSPGAGSALTEKPGPPGTDLKQPTPSVRAGRRNTPSDKPPKTPRRK